VWATRHSPVLPLTWLISYPELCYALAENPSPVVTVFRFLFWCSAEGIPLH